MNTDKTSDGEYSEQWAELRALHRRLFWYSAAAATIVMVLAALTMFASEKSGGAFGIGLAIAWAAILVKLLLLQIEYSYWSCPRYGKRFHVRQGGLGWGNLFANRCVNCGLTKWTASEPDQQLKREVRAGSVLKLGREK
jgi:hypothetical protein